jgi:hypothetical protein
VLPLEKISQIIKNTSIFWLLINWCWNIRKDIMM